MKRQVKQLTGVQMSTYMVPPRVKNVAYREPQRQNWCFFCDKKQTHISRHLRTIHKDEMLVAKVESAALNTIQRSDLWSIVRKKGNHKHNMQVVENNEGVIRPERRSKYTRGIEEYVLCMYCDGTFLRKDLGRHLKTCNRVKDEGVIRVPTRSAAATGAVSMYVKHSVSEEFKSQILNRMTNNRVLLVITQDDSILRIGQRMFLDLDEVKCNRQMCMNTMREMGRLVLAARKIDSSIIKIKDLLDTRKWEVLIQASWDIGKLSDGAKKSTPTISLHCGQNIDKVARMCLADALKTQDENAKSLIQDFMELKHIEWKLRIVSKSRKNLRIKKVNKANLIPYTEDIKTMTDYVKANVNRLVKLVKSKNATPQVWSSLCSFLFVRLVVFNRKRVGEIANFRLEEWKERQLPGELRNDMKAALTKTEQFFCKTMTRVETVGKRLRAVPMLFTEEMVEALEVLIEYRESVGLIPASNVYVFALAKSVQGYIYGCQIISTIADACGANVPTSLRSTKLRHHIATTSQLFDLGRHELEQLATFMGHDISVHRNYYRLAESTMQTSKVSLILQALDNGSTASYANKTLDQIEFNDLMEVNGGFNDEDARGVTLSYEDQDENDREVHLSEVESDDEDEDETPAPRK
jgi:hypothetical protein